MQACARIMHIGMPSLEQRVLGTVPEQTEQQRLAEQFDRVLRGKLPLVAPVSFPGDLPEVTSITVLPMGEHRATTRALQIIPYYAVGGRERHETLTLRDDGVFMGTLPRDFPHGVRKEDVLRVVYNGFERLKLHFWIHVGLDLLPPGERPDPAGGAMPGNPRTPPAVDPHRLEFLEQQEGALFGFVNREHEGFHGYHVIVFHNFVVLEHPRQGNAAYFIDFDAPVDPDQIPQDEDGRRAWVLRQSWITLLGKTRDALRAQPQRPNVDYLEHRGDWFVAMQVKIDERLRRIP